MNRLQHREAEDPQFSSEAGFASIRMVLKGMGALAAGAALAAPWVLGGASVARTAIRVEDEITVTAGKGTLDQVYMIQPELCLGGYGNNVEGAEADFRRNAGIGSLEIPGTDRALWWKTTADLRFENLLCLSDNPKDVEGRRVENLDTNEVVITIPETAFGVVTAPDFMAAKYTPDYAPGAALTEAISLGARASSNWDGRTFSDNIMGELENTVTTASADSSAKECGELAYGYLRDAIEDVIIDRELAEAGRQGKELTRDQVTVNMPLTVDLTSNYSDDLDKIREEAEKSNGTLTITLPDEDNFICEPVDNLQLLSNAISVVDRPESEVGHE